MFRLGNSAIDLYIIIMNRLGRLERDAGGEDHLYRVKGQLTNTLNNLANERDRQTTPKYV
jgi:hypothetical protein